MSIRNRVVAVAALTTLVAAAVALPASADDTRPPVPEPVDDEARAALCERIPAALDRMTERIATIQAGEDSPGSLAWLGRRADHAHGKGHDDLGRMLEHRMERRADRLERLQENLERLTQAQAAYCTGS
jgi:hypothetical protein